MDLHRGAGDEGAVDDAFVSDFDAEGAGCGRGRDVDGPGEGSRAAVVAFHRDPTLVDDGSGLVVDAVGEVFLEG